MTRKNSPRVGRATVVPLLTCFSIFTLVPDLVAQVTGPSTLTAPYVLPTAPNVKTTSIFTTGDIIHGYSMVGIPDGLGAFDNGNGTFTVLMNHEIGTAGRPRRPWGCNATTGSRELSSPGG